MVATNEPSNVKQLPVADPERMVLDEAGLSTLQDAAWTGAP